MLELVIFSAGSVSGDTSCVGVSIIDDSIVEIDQSFTLHLVPLSPDVIIPVGGGIATVTITDDDGNTN